AEESAGSSPSRPVFSGRQEGPWPSPCFKLRIHLSIHYFASGRSRGLGAPLRKPVGDCDKSRNRESLCALARVDAQFGEIRRGNQPRKIVSQSLSPHRKRPGDDSGEAGFIQGIELRNRARYEAHDGGVNFRRRPERTRGDREEPLEAE